MKRRGRLEKKRVRAEYPSPKIVERLERDSKEGLSWRGQLFSPQLINGAENGIKSHSDLLGIPFGSLSPTPTDHKLEETLKWRDFPLSRALQNQMNQVIILLKGKKKPSKSLLRPASRHFEILFEP